MQFVPGMIVRISNLSKSSYYLYRAYLQYSSLMICPCKLKKDQLLIVEETLKDRVLMKAKDRNVFTITYAKDLEPVYER